MIKSNQNFDKVILSSKKLTKVNDLIDYLLIHFRSDIKLKRKSAYTKKYIFFGDNSFAVKNLKWQIKKTIFDAVLEMKKFSI